ncbi:MAG: DNA repair protein RecO [Lachnospiraceae bacterium]|nr:DNA repair protein RecO [Lachnospiraceae bacterium]
MTDLTIVKGLIIKVEPIGEYDRRIVMLTDDRGKISAFAKGARRTNSKLVAGTNMFCFGEFGLYNGRNSYSVNDVKVINYFSFLRDDFVSAYYGMYFAEIADYYCRENLDDKDMLTLLYQSLRALESDKFDNRLVKAVYEIKTVMLQGEFRVRDNARYSDDTMYTLDHIAGTRPAAMYNFNVSDKVLDELTEIGKDTIRYCVDVSLKSAQILETLV